MIRSTPGQSTASGRALGRVIAMKPKLSSSTVIQYLEMEDWQTVGKFYGVHGEG